MQTINPYIAGNPIKNKDGFVGRENIFRDVMQMLRHPGENAIVLFGQRRIGKTTVLLQLAQRLSAEGQLTPVYFDLQDKASSSLASVLYELAQSIAARIGQPSPDRSQFDAEGRYFRDSFLPTVATQSGPDGLVLLLDEFDVLDTLQQTQAGQSFFPYLRAWMADIQRVKFVFVIGRRPEELSIETLSTFKGVRAARVSLLGRPEVEAIVRRSEGNGSLAWPAEAVEKVWDWTQGHTYFTQLLCNIVWEEIHDDAHRPQPLQATPEDVERSVSEALKQGANAFHWIWDGLPPAERVVIAAMAEASEAVISQERIEEILNRSGVRLVVRELKLAPDILIDWELLHRVGDSGSQTFQFAVPILRRWVKANRPLSRVKDELDRLDPLAESLFRTGQSFYSLGQVDEAERQIRQAIRVNPNHLKSRLLLGRILLESGSEKGVKESVEVLEEAYKYDPGSASPDLIKALLALVDLQTEDNPKFKLYERILQIQPRQPAAENGRKNIALAVLAGQLERARQYESRGEWDQALAIYQDMLKYFPDDQELATRLKAAQMQVDFARLYAEAIQAIDTGDKQKAKRLLAQVLTQDPDYKDAADLLSQLVNPPSEDGSVPFKLLLVIGSAFLSILIGLGVLISSILLLSFLSDSTSDVAILVTSGTLFWLWWLIYRANKQEGTSPTLKLLLMIGSAFLSILIGLGVWLGVLVSTFLLLGFLSASGYSAVVSMAGNVATLATLAALFWLWWLIYRANKQEGTSPTLKLLLMIGSAFLSILIGLGVLVSSILLLVDFSASTIISAVTFIAVFVAATVVALGTLFWLWWLIYRANKREGTSPILKLLLRIGSVVLSILISLGGCLVSSTLLWVSFFTSDFISSAAIAAPVVATLVALGTLFWLRQQEVTSPSFKMLVKIESAFLSILIGLGVWLGALAGSFVWMDDFFARANIYKVALIPDAVAILVPPGILFWLWWLIYRANKQEGTSPTLKLLLMIGSAFLSILVGLGIWLGVLVSILLLPSVLVNGPFSVPSFFIGSSPAAIAELVVATLVALGVFFRLRTLVVRSDKQG